MSEKWINFKTLNLEHTFRETLCALEALLLMSTRDIDYFPIWGVADHFHWMQSISVMLKVWKQSVDL